MTTEATQLTLVRNFSRANSDNQFGYQKVDDTTVLERKNIPVAVYNNNDTTPWAVWIRVYDFKSCEVLTYAQEMRFADKGSGAGTGLKNFTEVEGRQAIMDAYTALVGLGGHPEMPTFDQNTPTETNPATPSPKLLRHPPSVLKN